jgi:hypothetical protein
MPNNPKNRLTITGTPHPNHPLNEYSGMEMREAMTNPTRRPMVPASRVDPGIERM